ncbi:MAG: hypothetical protein P4M14_05705 [Gammaproteobacteria bacterium]|nr:hypothetical protein [Gammaproteobacteria bacterium]
MPIIYQRILFFCALCLPVLAVAATHPAGIGQVANNMLEPVYLVSDFVSSAAIIIGGTCLFGAFLKYMQYRINPLAAPMSTVLVLFLMGLVLVCLPLAYKLTESGVPFHLL